MVHCHRSRLTSAFVLGCLLLVVGCQPTTETAHEKAELKRHTVSVDGHPIALWEKSAENATEAILLLHGRTWSALPDFDLQVDGEELSLMDGLVAEGYAVFAVDLRGYGETPRDETDWLTPNRSADDLGTVISWIDESREWRAKPHLFGWSMGSTIAQLTVQRHPDLVSSLTLFGYWHDSDNIYPTDESDAVPLRAPNTAEAAASDFIVPGSISQNAIDTYVEEALKADPIKVDLRNLDHYNNLDGSKVNVPVLILQGEHDPVGPTAVQAKLFAGLASSHKQWATIPGGDHAALLEKPRDYFIHSFVSFLRGVTEHR